MTKNTRFSPEVRQRAVRMVLESQGEYDSQWAAICSIAPKIGCTPETLRVWVHETVYEGLYRTVGKRRMSQFIEDLLRPHVVDSSLDDGYKAMREDTERETAAMEWCNALAGDMANAAR